MSTTWASSSTSQQRWILIDAKGQVLGRLATRIATILRGKHKPCYTPFMDTGDFVVVINAEQIAVTGRKREQKIYQRYSGYPGGRKETVMKDLLEAHPERILHHAVKGMLPDGPLARQMIGKLKIYAGDHHPHAAQQPQAMVITN